jgi:hypothetical protein
VEISWYDPASQKQEPATAPAIDVTASEQTAFQSPIAPPQPAPPVSADPSRWKLALLWTVGALLAIALIAWLGSLVLPRVRAWGMRWHDEREHSEPAHFEYSRRRAVQATGDGQAGWQPHELLNAISGARRNWLRKSKGTTRKQPAALPALNP